MNTRVLVTIACVSTLVLASCEQKITVKTGTGDTTSGAVIEVNGANSGATIMVEAQSGVQVEVNGGNVPTVTVDSTTAASGAQVQVTPDGVNVVATSGAVDVNADGVNVDGMSGNIEVKY